MQEHIPGLLFINKNVIFDSLLAIVRRKDRIYVLHIIVQHRCWKSLQPNYNVTPTTIPESYFTVRMVNTPTKIAPCTVLKQGRFQSEHGLEALEQHHS